MTFSILRVFCTRNRMFFNPKQNRHPERSAAQIYRITNGLLRVVEEPVPSVAEGTPAMLVGRYSLELSNHKLQSKLKKVTSSGEAEGSAVRLTRSKCLGSLCTRRASCHHQVPGGCRDD